MAAVRHCHAFQAGSAGRAVAGLTTSPLKWETLIAMRDRRSALVTTVLVGAAAALLLALPQPAPAQVSGPGGDREIAVTELATPHPAAANRPAQTPAADSEPLHVTLLDVAAKLSAMVLLVYGVAYAIGVGRRKGWRVKFPSSAPANSRLALCCELPLRGGAALHIVEVDDHPLLLATHGTGDVSLLLDLAPPQPPAEEASPQALPRTAYTAADSIAPGGAAGQFADIAWEDRRDALIQALTQRP